MRVARFVFIVALPLACLLPWTDNPVGLFLLWAWLCLHLRWMHGSVVRAMAIAMGTDSSQRARISALSLILRLSSLFGGLWIIAVSAELGVVELALGPLSAYCGYIAALVVDSTRGEHFL